MLKKINSLSDLENFRESIMSSRQNGGRLISVSGWGCTAGRSSEVIEAFEKEIAARELGSQVETRQTGCLGFCAREPIVVIHPQEIFYQEVRQEDAAEIVERTIMANQIVERLLYIDPVTGQQAISESDIPFYQKQKRIILGNNSRIDPTSINDYLSVGGYSALARVFTSMSPDDIIEAVKQSGLRGRGGAGFPTGRKWEFCRKASGDYKFVICNADEGDPGAYMDRAILEGNPHSVLEGMLIGAYAIGANEGFIYVRDEYPLAVKCLEIAIAKAKEYGLLGRDILGSGFNFSLKLSRGGGAFVCGEETALILSIEGNLGEPRQRPPFPAQQGLWRRPTNINNVETWASVPHIINNGADWFASIGTENSKGTKVFSLVGKINNTGLVEVPMGTRLHDIVFGIGGGIPGGNCFKAVQTGGPSGGCLPAVKLDLPVDYEQLAKAGAIMGSGGMIVMDERTCMVDVARYFLNFLKDESCGKCVACREGIERMLEILTKICEGEGQEGDLEILEEICHVVKDFALCALGSTAPNPVLSTLTYFRDEYEAHIKYKRCPAVVCKKIISSPCQHTCPLGTDVPAYLTLIAQGKISEAVEVIRMTNPLPVICGRVCHHPCEDKCTSGEGGDPIAIKALKRFATDYVKTNGDSPKEERPKPKYEKVAVIGSGPAGLTAGYDLARKGYRVTIFEAMPVPGGMLASAIPDYRLPKNLIEADIENIRKLGVEIKTNVSVGKDILIDELFQKEFRAIFIAVGAHENLKLGIPGEKAKGVLDPLQFLKDVKAGKKVRLGEKVGIIGGGNVAIDAARTARRLGKEVTIFYRRTRTEMPANDEEITEAIQEGVKIDFLIAPTEILSRNGKLSALGCSRMRLEDIDGSGRRRPIPIKGSEFTVELDTIIPAIGQKPALPLFSDKDGIEITKGGVLAVDPETMATSRPGIFAGGDAVSGPATVTEAMASARVAAESIHRFLRGESLHREYSVTRPHVNIEPIKLTDKELDELLESQRPEMPTLPVADRLKSFTEVELGFSKEMAMAEARRCLRCDRAG
jgi:NADH-quinone oxidoreductase subunit F